MELDDCAFPLLHAYPYRRPDGRVQGRRGRAAGRRAPARSRHGEEGPPRGERQDLAPQGRALGAVASRKVRVLVVGNPANTNCLIAMRNAPA